MAYDIDYIRSQFPILDQQVHGRPLVYLDNAATAQKPKAVVDAISHYYYNDNANVHRGVHTLSQRATDAMEAVREQVREHIGARESAEIIFTRGITDSINTVAFGMGALIKPHQNVVITALEPPNTTATSCRGRCYVNVLGRPCATFPSTKKVNLSSIHWRKSSTNTRPWWLLITFQIPWAPSTR